LTVPAGLSEKFSVDRKATFGLPFRNRHWKVLIQEFWNTGFGIAWIEIRKDRCRRLNKNIAENGAPK